MLLSVRCLDDIYETVILAKLTYLPKAILLLFNSKGLAPWAQGLPPGVVGCVPTDAPAEMLQAAIRLVLAGGMFFTAQVVTRPTEDPDQAVHLLAGAAADCPLPLPLSCPHEESAALGLTPRQYEVLVLLARGYTLKAIGRHLNIAVATAKVHAETLYQRLQVHNRNEAVYTAISRGATLGWPSKARVAA
ncbi:DNA-binding response regulator [Bordetella petrii]|nr:DNA-binding response regulator [Bordetella petrii]